MLTEGCPEDDQREEPRQQRRDEHRARVEQHPLARKVAACRALGVALVGRLLGAALAGNTLSGSTPADTRGLRGLGFDSN